MNFREFLDSDEFEARVTDRWPVNKSMYDMDDPDEKKRYEDDLKERLSSMRRKVVSDRIVEEPYVITCWRGFDLRSFERDAERIGGKLYLKGDKAMSGMLWFTYDIQPVHHYDPREYALEHAYGDGYLLTYPLKCKRSYREVVYNNGSNLHEPPEGTKTNPTELDNMAVIGGRLYELPSGWHFTWQVEKNIGFKGRLEVSPPMLQRV
ncbi:hypothetical protein EBT16_03335 [bacterium]|nr:hypothetical protein [bacterium]